MQDWKTIPPQEASDLLFYTLVELMLQGKGYNLSAEVTIKVLTQRLYGDYRQVHNTQEFKRAEKHVKHFKTTGLGHELF